MSRSHARVIGTTIDAISKAEGAIGFDFPAEFREWLIHNNSRSVEDVTIFPVFDERDPRKTWDSIVRNFNENWQPWISSYGPSHDFSHLLPFGEAGTGDYFCFDFADVVAKNKVPVVVWLHETGETQQLAEGFSEFITMANKGGLEY